MITRREFVAGTSALAILAALNAPALAQGAAPSTAELMETGVLPDQILGKEDAPVTVIEYASMTCCHCATFHTTTYPQVRARALKVAYNAFAGMASGVEHRLKAL